jgi:hypothetical protein
VDSRVWISIANVVAIVLALFALVEYPVYANEVFYLLIGWMITGFVLLYVIRPRGPPAPASPITSPFPSTGPEPAALPSSSEPAGGLGFCIYCAAPIAPGARACPSCGHALPRW